MCGVCVCMCYVCVMHVCICVYMMRGYGICVWRMYMSVWYGYVVYVCLRYVCAVCVCRGVFTHASCRCVGHCVHRGHQRLLLYPNLLYSLEAESPTELRTHHWLARLAVLEILLSLLSLPPRGSLGLQ